MLLSYALLGASALFIMAQDVREQTIPISGLIVFAGISLCHHVIEPNAEGFWVAGIIAVTFMACQGLFYLMKRGPAMGWGDLILSPFCGLWLHFHELPLYFIVTGIFALLICLFWWYQWRLKTFPMAPALLFGLGLILVIRWFLTANGI